MAECLKKTDEFGKEGLLQNRVHEELTGAIMSLTEEEVKLVIRLLASSQI